MNNQVVGMEPGNAEVLSTELSVLLPGYLYDPATHMIWTVASGREVPDLSVLKLDLCNRARHIIERDEKTLRSAPDGDVMISDLLRLSHDEFYGLRNMGVKTADETLELIRNWLAGKGKTADPDVSHPSLIADSFIVPEYRLFDGTIRNVSSLLEVPDEPVQVLNLGNRASNALKKAGIDCLSQLVSLSASDLKDLRSLGAMTEAEIREKLKAYLDLHVLNPVAPGVAVRDGLIVRLAGECLVPDQLLSQFDVPQKTKEILSGNGLHLLSDVVSVSRVQLLSLEGLAESDGEALIDEIQAFLDSVDSADPVVLPEAALETLRHSKAPQGSVLAEDYCLLNGIIRNRATGRAVPEALVSALKLSPINASLLTAAGYPVVSSLIGLDYDVLMKVHAFREETVRDISRALLQYLQRKGNGQEMPQEVQEAGRFGAEDLLRFFHEHEFDVLSFADIREAFQDIRERLLVPAVAQLIREGVLLQDGDRYSLHHDTLMEYVRKLLDRQAKSLNTRNVNVLLRRLNGESQPEIAKALGGMTRERVRQLEEKAKEVINLSLKAEGTCLEEDRWRHLFTTYGGSRELYLKYLHLPESTWNYLGLWYKRGTVSPEEALADESLSVFARRAIEQYIHLKDVRLDGAYISATRVALEDYVLEKCCRDLIGFDDFCDLYNGFLQEHGITDEDLLITDSVRSTRKNRLTDSEMVLWTTGYRLRRYDIAGGDYTDLFEALNLAQYRDIDVSAVKLFEDNREIMRQYDIRDGNELHNLLRKLHADSENPTLSFGRMPTLAFGHFDRDQAVREILFALAPVSQDELAEMISLEYGYPVPTVKADWLGCVQEYYNKGMYSVDYVDLPEEHAALLKQELTDDCYLFSEVQEIYSRLVENADTSLISSYNMKKMGFQVGVGYILQNYPSLEAYLNHLMTGNEGFDMAPLSARFGYLRSFDAYVRRLKNNLDIIEFGENHYISMKFLEKLGVTKEGIREFADRVLAFHVSEDFFSLHSLKKAGFRDEMEKIGFGEVFMVSLLKADPRLSWQRVSGTVVFNPKNEPFAIRDFIRFVVGKTGPVGVDELRAEILEEYGADLSVKKVMDRVYGSEMYYDPVGKKVYPSAEAYVREFE